MSNDDSKLIEEALALLGSTLVDTRAEPWLQIGAAIGFLQKHLYENHYQCSQEPHAGANFYGYDGGCAECGYVPPIVRCPSVSPSGQRCIGTTEPWHEVHADKIGSTWRNYEAKK